MSNEEKSEPKKHQLIWFDDEQLRIDFIINGEPHRVELTAGQLFELFEYGFEQKTGITYSSNGMPMQKLKYKK